jgi:hypothetical protein
MDVVLAEIALPSPLRKLEDLSHGHLLLRTARPRDAGWRAGKV